MSLDMRIRHLEYALDEEVDYARRSRIMQQLRALREEREEEERDRNLTAPEGVEVDHG